MLRTYLMSFVAQRWNDAKALTRAPSDAWLVWEPGEWKAPRRDKTTLVKDPAARPKEGDALVYHLPVPKRAAPLIIGRAPDAGLVLNDATVSRHHVELFHDGDAWCARPCERKAASRNGEPLASRTWTQLAPGDALRIGNVTLSFLDEAGLAARVAAPRVGNSVDFVEAAAKHPAMSGALRVRGGVTLIPLPSPGPEPAFAVRSPVSNGLLELSTPAVRLLSAFGRGATVERVAQDLEQDRAAVAASVDELARLGLLERADAPPMAKAAAAPIFVVASPGSQANLLQSELGRHPALAGTPLSSLIQDACVAHEAAWLRKDLLGVPRAEQLKALRASLEGVLAPFTASRQKQGWVYNSRDLDLFLPLVDELFGHTARFCVVVRHPLDTVFTLASNLDQYGPQISPHHDLGGLLRRHSREVAIAHYWASVYARIRAFRASGGARVAVVKAEALAGPLPAAEFLKVFAALGLTWAPADAAAAPQNPGRVDKPATTVLASAAPGGQWKSVWSAEQLAAVTAVVADEAKAWGYTIDKGAR